MINLGFFGDGLWASKTLKRLLENKDVKISFIFSRFHQPDKDLKLIATRHKIPFLNAENVNSKDVIKKITSYKVDIFVSMSFDQIFKSNLIRIPKKGVINCHAGSLPSFRGRNPINWALINGEEHIGITVHYIDDERIDSGDIIYQIHHKISPSDKYNTLLKKCYDWCANAVVKSLDLIIYQKVIPIKQNPIWKKSYFSFRRTGDEWINWEWTSIKIHNFIRAINEPGPGACTLYKANKIIINKSLLLEDYQNYIGKPGEVIGFKDNGLIIKTGDNAILINGMFIQKNKKKYKINSNYLKIGSRLGIDFYEKYFEVSKRLDILEQKIKDNEKK